MFWEAKKKINVSSCFAISLIALSFAYWFTTNQFLAISADAMQAFYPRDAFAFTMIRSFLCIITLFAFSIFILPLIVKDKVNDLYIALAYTPLVWVYLQVPLYWIALSILFFQFLIVRNVGHHSHYRIDAFAFLLILLLHLFVSTGLSPLHWQVAWRTSAGAEEIPMVASLFKGFVHAKQFAFSTMDYAEWGSVLNPPITLNSPFLELITFILDLPSISIESFHIVLLAVNFILIIVGSFGFYLFLKYALKIQSLFALVGGMLFFFSPFAYQMMVDDGGIFISSYVIFPYALLFITLAFQKQSMISAIWAGFALAAQFFFLTPHPEGVIYSTFFYGIYTFSLIYFTQYLPLKNKLAFSLLSCVVFSLLALFVVLPIFVDQLNGNMHAYAHMKDMQPISFASFRAYAFLALVYFFIAKKITPLSSAHKSVHCLAFFLLLLMTLTTQAWFNNALINFLHLGINVSHAWRIGLFFDMMVFVLAITSLEVLTRSFTAWMKRQKRQMQQDYS